MIHQNRFKNKVIIVTGAAQGIGRSVALHAAKEGAIVLMVDKSEIVFEVCQEDIFENCIVKPFIADMEVFDQCSLAINEAVNTCGKVDILINNVGGPIWAKPYEH